MVEELNKSAGKPQLGELEKEARVALSLAPRLEYGKKVLAEIEQRRVPGAAARNAGGVQVVLNHRERNADGWLVCESPSFQIYYKDSQEFADQAAQIAESCAPGCNRNGSAAQGREWTPALSIYLHPTATDYSKVTGQYNSPGHSSIRIENGHFVTRQIDLHCDDSNLLAAIFCTRPLTSCWPASSANYRSSACHAGPMRAWPSSPSRARRWIPPPALT